MCGFVGYAAGVGLGLETRSDAFFGVGGGSWEGGHVESYWDGFLHEDGAVWVGVAVRHVLGGGTGSGARLGASCCTSAEFGAGVGLGTRRVSCSVLGDGERVGTRGVTFFSWDGGFGVDAGARRVSWRSDALSGGGGTVWVGVDA
jgi:hypothetical protein